MASFAVEIFDKNQLKGLKAAREAYNSELPDETEQVDDPKQPGRKIEKKTGRKVGQLDNDVDYINHVVRKACESYYLSLVKPKEG